MNSRPFAVAGCAATITSTLLVGMTMLIETGVAAPLPVQRKLQRFVSVPTPPAPPPPIEKPVAPPPPMPAPDTNAKNMGISTWEPVDDIAMPGPGMGLVAPDTGSIIELSPAGSDDGPAIEVIPVQPIYPRSMMARGLEGSVIVSYDINAAGRVANSRVVSSTHSGFDRAALEAIQRFRYQPRMVDGQAIGTQGLRKQFSFTIER